MAHVDRDVLQLAAPSEAARQGPGQVLEGLLSPKSGYEGDLAGQADGFGLWLTGRIPGGVTALASLIEDG